MQRNTFGQLRLSDMPGAVGLCSTDSTAIAAYANEAIQRLLTDPLAPDEGWWGGWARMAFNVSRFSPTIVTPNNVARIILLDVNQHPVRIRNEFFEFLDFGNGLMPKRHTCNNYLQAYERDTVPTLSPLVPPATIRVYPQDPSDVGQTVLVQGADQNGKTIYSVDPATNQTFIGERITLALPFTDSVNTFTTITGLQKDPTNFPVTFNQVNLAGVESTLSFLDVGENVGQYRTYFINGLRCNQCLAQVQALVKFDFSPVSQDSDYLLVQNLPALKEECMGIYDWRLHDTAAQARGDAHHKKALGLLFGELSHFLGNERPSISVPLWSKRNSIRPQPV